VRGVQPLACTGELLVDLVNRVPQLVPFLFELMLKLINIFVCAHNPGHPRTVGLVAEFLAPIIGRSTAASDGVFLIHVSRKMARGVSSAQEPDLKSR
jgi:hypothetical protein